MRLAVVGRTTEIAALVVAAAVALGLVWEFVISWVPVLLYTFGADPLVLISQVLWWIKVAASLVALACLIIGWRLDRPVWAPGVLQVALGLVVLWGWWALNRYVDLWGWHDLSQFQLDHFAEDAGLVALSWASTIVNLLVKVAGIVLLVVGARRLLGAQEPARVPVAA